MYKVCVIHGPNLNLLGKREPSIYGNHTLEDLNKQLVNFGISIGADVETFQSNYEGAIVDKIQQLHSSDFLIINAAAYTHTSIAIRDALLAVGIPAIEVHISNIYKRDSFRHHSYIADVVEGQITGLGVFGYQLALQAAVYYLQGGKTGE
jgi:3-dehydroquinate dehydratase-2